MKKVKGLAKAYLASVKRHRVTTTLALALASGGAFAADGSFDMTTPLAYIAGGVTAYAAIGPAMTGLTYVKKVWGKLGGR